MDHILARLSLPGQPAPAPAPSPSSRVGIAFTQPPEPHPPADTDKRIHALDDLRQHCIQQLQTPGAHPDRDRDRDLVAALKPPVKSSNALIANHAVAALEPYFLSFSSDTRTASPSALKYALAQLVPWEKLADAKPQTRTLATRAVVAAARAALSQSDPAPAQQQREPSPWTLIEVGLKDHGFASKNARAREQAVHILATLRSTSPPPLPPPPSSSADLAPVLSPPTLAHPLPPLRPFTPLLLPLLADADPHVRSAALEAAVRIFADPAASDGARADLKKEMKRIGVAQRVQDHILAQVLGGRAQTEHPPAERTRSTSPASASSRSGPGDPPMTAGPPAHVPAGPPPSSHAPSSTADVVPVYIASERDLDAEFAAMRSAFDGRESEHNWTARDRSVARIRGMLVARVADRDRLCDAFVRNVRDVQDGIIKTVRAASLPGNR